MLAPVALFVIFNGMLMPVAVWINSMDIDIGQVFDSNQIALSVLISLFFFFKVVTIRNYNGTINCVINYLMLHQVSIPNILSDDERLRHWVKTRIIFNMLDAQYHESVTHLGNLFDHRKHCFSLSVHEKIVYELFNHYRQFNSFLKFKL